MKLYLKYMVSGRYKIQGKLDKLDLCYSQVESREIEFK